MFLSLFGAVEEGLIYAIIAIGVYLSFRILDFPDLTVDGSFVTGIAVASMAILSGIPPIIATILAMFAGFLAGLMTGLLHTKGKVNPLLAGILMMTALYSINLRIMGGKPSLALLNESTIFKQVFSFWERLPIDATMNQILETIGFHRFPKTFSIIFIMMIIVILIKIFIDYFLQTEVGLALRATGDNQQMIRSFSANTDLLIIIGIGISNGLVGLAGGLFAQYSGSANIGMGVGLIITGLASVIIGEALFGTKTIFRTTMAVIFGAIIYRIVITLALRTKFLEAGDMKFITATLVIIALVTPNILQARREKQCRKKRNEELLQKAGEQ
ncbi:MAG TPA: ABC transporter permease [Bacillota bacterium]|nr:ABC transporter permease [Bacillota bacterium]